MRLEAHWETLAALDFFTVEVLTLVGIIRFMSCSQSAWKLAMSKSSVSSLTHTKNGWNRWHAI